MCRRRSRPHETDGPKAWRRSETTRLSLRRRREGLAGRWRAGVFGARRGTPSSASLASAAAPCREDERFAARDLQSRPTRPANRS